MNETAFAVRPRGRQTLRGRAASQPLVQLTLVRIREFVREPEAVFWTFFFPTILAVALGIAFRGSGEEAVPVAVEAGPRAHAVVAALRASGRAEAEVLAAGEADDELRRGSVALVVTAEAGAVRYRYDPTRADSRTARLIVDDVLQRAAGRTDPRRVLDIHVTERGSRYIDFLIPGLLGLNLLSTGLWGVGYTVVRMRSDRLLKRFATTPVRRSDFLLSFMLGRLLFLALELPLLIGFAVLAFGVPVRGSLGTLALAAMLGAFSFTGLGLLVASRTRSTEGVQGWMNLVAVPMWILCGVFFSAAHFPDAMQPLIQALPLTAMNNALRAVMLDGASLLGIVGSLAIVSAWGAASFMVALAIFRWR
jgi:ABC-2 type transport system permease protein